MTRFLTACPRGVRRLAAATGIAIACLATPVSGVGKDKALYVGGTRGAFPSLSRMVNQVAWGGSPKLQGTIDVMSETEFRFDADGRDSVTIPYKAITSLTYGLKAGGRGVVLVIPWEVTEQYTTDPHYMLTIVYQDQSGTEQASVFELGKALVRPTLEALERRSGKAVEFLNVEACVLFRTAEACGYGSPAELKGLTKVFLDARGENRDLILGELKKAGTGVEVIDDSASAEVLVTFGTERSMNPQCRCEGGRGEVIVGQDAGRRVVLVFADRKVGVWGKKPATNFGVALTEAFKAANEPAKKAR